MGILTKFNRTFNSKHYKYLSNFAFAQLFVVAITPLFSRIYSPNDLGVSSLFITISLLLGSFTSLSFENSFFIEDEENSIDCLVLCVLICILLSSIISFIPINFLFEKFFGLTNNPIFRNLLPLNLFLIGLNNIFKSFANKKGFYKLLGINKVIFSISVPTFTIIFGYLNYSYEGILMAFIIGLFIVNINFFIGLRKHIIGKIFPLNFKNFYFIFYKNKSLIFWTMPSNFVSNLSSYLPVIFIGNFFGSAVLGQYELAMRAFYFPVGILISTIKDVFKEKISNSIKQNRKLKNTFNNFFQILTKISILIILPFSIFFPYLYRFIFGPEWSDGGFLIHILIPLLCINFISSPLSIILIIKKKQKLDFIWQIFFLITTLTSFAIPRLFLKDISIELNLLIYSFSSFIMYLIAIAISSKVSNIYIPAKKQTIFKKNLCHLTLTSFENETRVLKQVLVQSKINQINKTYVIAIQNDSLKEYEKLDCGAYLYRINLLTKKLSKLILFQFIKYIEMIFKIINIIINKNIDIIVIHSLPLLPLAGILKFFFNIKIIYDCHEIETEKYGLNILRKMLVRLIEFIYIYYVDLVLVVSPSIEKWYRKKYKLDNIITILNTPNYPIVKNGDYLRQKFNIKTEQTIIIYVGAFLEGRCIEDMIKIFSKLYEKNICLVLIGYGDLLDKVKLAHKKYNNIFYHEAVKLDKLVKIISSADLGIAYIVNGSINDDYCLPNKFFEYIYSGIPVITSKSPDMEYYIKKYNIGIAINELSYNELLTAIGKILMMNKELLQKNLKEAKYATNWENEANKLILAMEKYELI